MWPNGGVHPYLLVRSQQDFSRVIVMPLARKMGIKSQQEFQNQQQEIQFLVELIMRWIEE